MEKLRYWDVRPSVLNYTSPTYKADMRRFGARILASNDPRIVLQFARDVRGISLKPYENYIAKHSGGRYIFLYAKYIKDANFQRLQRAILKTEDMHWIMCFASLPKADYNLFEDIVASTKCPRYVYNFIKGRNNVNIEKFKTTILESGKSRYLYELAKHVSPEEREVIQQMIIKNKSNMYVRLYAQNIPDADISKLERRIISTKSKEQINKFATKVEKSERCKRLRTLF